MKHVSNCGWGAYWRLQPLLFSDEFLMFLIEIIVTGAHVHVGMILQMIGATFSVTKLVMASEPGARRKRE